jgi:hypothetical protein
MAIFDQHSLQMKPSAAPNPNYREAGKDSGYMNRSKRKLQQSLDNAMNVILKHRFDSAT